MTTNDGRIEYTASGHPVVHGKASSYNNHRCRCRECKDAWADYMRDRVRKHRAKKKREEKRGVNINL